MNPLWLVPAALLALAVWVVLDARRSPADPYVVAQGPAVEVTFTHAQAIAVDEVLWAARTATEFGFTDADRGLVAAAWHRLNRARAIAAELTEPTPTPTPTPADGTDKEVFQRLMQAYDL